MNAIGLSQPVLRPIELPSLRGVLSSLWVSDLAMDLGTANTLIYVKGRGIVVNEPSVVAVDEETEKPIAIGSAAKEMYGKTSQAVRCIRPMKDGVIADFDMATLMIRHMLLQVCSRTSIRKPRIVIGVPSGITQVEKRAVIDAALSSGVRQVHLVEEPMAAAVGAGLPIHKPCGNMIVDIGGGTTEVAIISMNGTAYSHSIRVAGDEMDEAIVRHMRREHNLQVGIFEAERIKLVIGSALAFDHQRQARVFGRDMVTGIPQQVDVSDEEIRYALNEPIRVIVSSIIAALEQTSPEIAQDIMSRGIYVAGGGALIKGLTERLQRETGLPFFRASDPLSCVVRGVGQVLENLKEMQEVCIC
ncbi:MAG: rod shape-determining protein [Bdellovibrionales bacterium]|nr:rod shape-determining protein [Bdellovibrionales bacterium]